MEGWVERLPEIPVITESDLTEDINQFYYRLSRKQQIYSISGGYRSTKQRYNNKIIERYYSQDNGMDVY